MRKGLLEWKEITIKMPKPKVLSFQTAIIERYRRGEAGVEEAMVEMYLAGGQHGALRTSRSCCGAIMCLLAR